MNSSLSTKAQNDNAEICVDISLTLNMTNAFGYALQAARSLALKTTKADFCFKLRFARCLVAR